MTALRMGSSGRNRDPMSTMSRADIAQLQNSPYRDLAELLSSWLIAPNALGILCKIPLSMLRVFAFNMHVMYNYLEILVIQSLHFQWFVLSLLCFIQLKVKRKTCCMIMYITPGTTKIKNSLTLKSRYTFSVCGKISLYEQMHMEIWSLGTVKYL